MDMNEFLSKSGVQKKQPEKLENQAPMVSDQLVESVIHHESGGKADAVSSKGAVGLMQLMPETAKSLGVTNRFDPEQNKQAGRKYLSQLVNKYNDIEKALIAYNWGPGNVDKHGIEHAPEESKKYARSIISRAYSHPTEEHDTNSSFPKPVELKKGEEPEVRGESVLGSLYGATDAFKRNLKDTFHNFGDTMERNVTEATNILGGKSSVAHEDKEGRLTLKPEKGHEYDEMIGASPLGGVGGTIKQVGGNALDKTIKDVLLELKYDIAEPHIAEAEISKLKSEGKWLPEDQKSYDKKSALNSWIDSSLYKYVARNLGSEKDPIKDLAKQGIYHIEPNELGIKPENLEENKNVSTALGNSKNIKNEIPPGSLGHEWERAADSNIRLKNSEKINKNSGIMEQHPWISKLEKPEALHFLDYDAIHSLGFENLIDDIRSGLDNGEITPEQLKSGNFNIEAAVRFSHNKRIEAEKIAKKSRVENVNKLNTVRPYENSKEGLKWVKLPKAEQDQEKIIQEVGKTGGWCTQDGENARRYGGGDSQLYALVDREGRAHAQASVQGNKLRQIQPPENSWSSNRVDAYSKKDNKYKQTIKSAMQDFIVNPPEGVKISEIGLNDSITSGVYFLKDGRPITEEQVQKVVSLAGKENKYNDKFDNFDAYNFINKANKFDAYWKEFKPIIDKVLSAGAAGGALAAGTSQASEKKKSPKIDYKPKQYTMQDGNY
jgi:Transglycosylase SLT domain